MATFKEQLAIDFNNIALNINEFAENAVYTPSGGEAKSIKAKFTYRSYGLQGELNGDWQRQEGQVLIAVSDVSSPQKGDKITNASGKEFKIDEVRSTTEVGHFIDIIEMERKSKGSIRKK